MTAHITAADQRHTLKLTNLIDTRTMDTLGTVKVSPDGRFKEDSVNNERDGLKKALQPVIRLSQALGVTFFKARGTVDLVLTNLYRVVVFTLLVSMLIHEIPTARFWVARLKSIHAMLAFSEIAIRWVLLILNTLLTILKNSEIVVILDLILNIPLSISSQATLLRVRRFQYLHILLNALLICSYMSLGHIVVWPNPNFKWYTILIYTVSEFYIGFVNMQFIDLLNVIREQFKVLNETLEKSFKGGILKKSNLFLISNSKEEKLTDVVRLRCVHLSLCTVSLKINNCYSVQILFFITLCVVEITYAFRSFMLFIVSSTDTTDHKPWLEFLLTFLWGGYYFTTLLQLVSCCDFTANESKKSSLIVHKIINNSQDKRIERQLHLFSLQLMNHSAVFTAGRFFNLDFALIHSIVGAITTYLVIIITFKE